MPSPVLSVLCALLTLNAEHARMMIIKLGLLTCLIYMTLLVVLDVSLTWVARLFGGVIVGGRSWGIAIIFAMVWVLSYVLAWRCLRFSLFRH